MKPVKCLVTHDPANKRHGDCVRACVASIMEMEADDVPHFYDYDVDTETGFNVMRMFLARHGMQPFLTAFAADNLEQFLDLMRATNPHVIYILTCNAGNNAHAIVGKGGKIIHDPAMYPNRDYRPLDDGTFQVTVIAKS